MIRHTVVFSLRHPRGSQGETDFLRDARVLAEIPGVQRFEQLRQTSVESEYALSFCMEFATPEHYADYEADPVHVAFVRDRWTTEVASFQELDFEPLDHPGDDAMSTSETPRAAATPAPSPGAAPGAWRELFDGQTLAGWRQVPRICGTVYPGGPMVHDVVDFMSAEGTERAAQHPAVWRVQDGVVTGEQETPGCGWGGYLVSEDTFGDFELEVEMRHDWPADTGIMVRRLRDSWEGFQVLVDHRKSGSIGGFFGNGLGSFHAVPFVLDAEVDATTGRPVRIFEEDPTTSLEPFTPDKRDLLEAAGSAQEFVDAWRVDGWNHLRVTCVGGALPRLSTWVNGVPVAVLDTSRVLAEHYDPATVAGVLGDRGHIALEVHDNDPVVGEARWGHGAACRWRGMRIRELHR